jgi:hypothetical protein
MNEQVIQQEQALKALISINKNGVKALLRNYKYRISDFYSANDLYAFLIVAISKSSAFTNDVLTLLKQASAQPYKNVSGEEMTGEESGGKSNVGEIIAGALQGLGLVTSTWQNTATTKANASNYNTAYSVDGKKTNTLVVAGVVLTGIILVGVMAVVVIKSTK